MNFETIRPVLYPRLIRRVRAILVDSIVLPIVVLGAVMVGSAVGVSNGYAKFAFLVMPIFFLEPVMVAVTGGTIGHHLLGVRIATLDGQRNINIFAATLRFVVKVLLGWFSMIFILTTKRHLIGAMCQPGEEMSVDVAAGIRFWLVFRLARGIFVADGCSPATS